MIKSRFVLPILVAILAVVVLATPGQENSPYGGTLILGAATRPKTINPIISGETIASSLAEMIFGTLVRFKSMNVIPDLATSWQISEDGLEWTFNIRRGVLFHDGAELTSRDVLFTYNTIVDPATGSEYTPLYAPVERFEAPDAYTFRVILKEPYAPLINLMKREILPSHLLEGRHLSLDDFGRRPIGTGPFKFAYWGTDEIVLHANENYHAGRPYLNSVRVKIFPTRLAAWSALMQGKLHVVKDLNYEDYRVIEDDPRFYTYYFPGGFYYTVLFNLEDPLLSDPRMREILDLAVERNDVIDKALQGLGSVATGPFIPGTWPCNPDVRQSYEPKRVMQMLKELGYRDEDGDLVLEKDGKDLSLHLVLDRGDSIKERAAKRIKWQLFQLGILLDVEVLDRSEFLQERLIPGNFQAALLQFNALGDPDKRTSMFWQSDSIGRQNLARYSNPEVDALLERGRVETDFDARREIYRRVHSLIAADRPALFLFFRRMFVGIAAEFRGIDPDPESFYRSIKDWYVIQ